MSKVGSDPSINLRRRPPASDKGGVVPRSTRHVAEAVAELRSPTTGALEGWRYRWEDGRESRLLLASLPGSSAMYDVAGSPPPEELTSGSG